MVSRSRLVMAITPFMGVRISWLMLARNSAALQRAIRWGEGDKLEELFTRTRAIRRGVIAEGQAYDRRVLTALEKDGEAAPKTAAGDEEAE
jgi:hypothetical protein